MSSDPQRAGRASAAGERSPRQLRPLAVVGRHDVAGVQELRGDGGADRGERATLHLDGRRDAARRALRLASHPHRGGRRADEVVALLRHHTRLPRGARRVETLLRDHGPGGRKECPAYLTEFN